MKLSNVLRLPFFILCLVSASTIYSESFAQKTSEGIKISGSVVDQEGKIVKGAVILIKGTTSGTATDLDGNFNLTVPSESSVLVVSFIDFKEEEVTVGEKRKFQISLQAEEKTTQVSFQLSENGFMVHDQVDQLPKPFVGFDAWNQYLAKNIKYPKSARESNMQGTVIVGFEVQEDGTVSNVEVIRGIGGECDQEAVRIIEEGPAWNPAKLANKAVATQISMPIRFVMAKETGISSRKQQQEKAIADRFGKHVVVVGYTAD